MNDEEKIKSFGDMVEATQKLTRPWKNLAIWLIVALVISNLFWAFVHYKTVKFAYMTPETFSQTQNFDGQTQEQNHEEGVAQGK